MTGLLEVIEIVSGEDGEDYAKQLKNLFKVVEDDKLQVNRSVLEGAVEMVLKDTRHGVPALFLCLPCPPVKLLLASSLFRVTCAASIITSIVELEIPFGPTFMVIASAFASEYCGQVSIPPVDILRGLATRLAHLARRLFFGVKHQRLIITFRSHSPGRLSTFHAPSSCKLRCSAR